MSLRALLLGAASALALASPVLAQSGAASSGTVVSPMVVTAAPYPVSLDSVTTHVEIITRDELDVAAPAGLGDLLAGSPGIRSTAYGPGASRPVIRGLSGARVLVLENGVGLVDASTLSPDHAVASDPGQASRIEVLRGPSALAYGGSGVGGVVNVIDERIPSKAAEDGVDGRIAVSGGSVDKSGSWSGAVKARSGPLVFALDASLRRSGDYDVPVSPLTTRAAQGAGVVADPAQVARNSDVDLSAFGAGASYVADEGYVGLSVKQTRTNYGIPYPQALGGFVGEPPVRIDLEQTRIDLRGEAPLALGPFDRARVSVGWADYEHVEVDSETGEVGTRFLSDGAEGRLELIQAEREGRQGAVGLQVLQRDLEAIGEEAFIPSVRIKELGLFTLQRLERGRYGLDLGLRVDRRKLETAAATRTFDNVSASAGASFKPSDPWFLALSASYNSRAPTEVELFANGPHAGTGAFEVGDPGLDAEKVASIEGTVRYDAGPVRIEGHLYVARYDGFIEEVPTGEAEEGLPVFRFTQSNADFYGGEIEAGVDVWSSAQGKLTLEGAADHVRGDTDAGAPPRIPPWSVTGRAILTLDRVTLAGEVRHVAEQDRIAAFETATAAYTVVNARAEYRPTGHEGLRLFAEGRNLTDEEVREHASFLKELAPQPGRSLRLGAAVTF
jgi:iron complex outermembrane recepter protein